MEMYRGVLAHPALSNPLLHKLSESQYDRSQVAHLVKGYVRYSKIFPKLLRTSMGFWKERQDIHSRLEGIFADEVNGSHGLSHSEQLDSCARSFGVDFREEVLDRIGTHYVTYAEKLLALCKSDKFTALGVIGPATEWVVPHIYMNFIRWFEKNGPEKYEFSFFSEHIEVDKEHASVIAEVIALATESQADRDQVAAGAYAALDARNTLWENIGPLIVDC